MARSIAARVAPLVLVALLALTGCAPAQTTEGPADAQEGFVSTAMVVTLGNGEVLFVDQETETPYYPTLPGDAPELTAGNIVRVTGNGIMLESYPAQYPGITRVEVVEKGAPADAEKYDELVAQIWQPKDPAEPPLASLEYTTDLAVVTLLPTTCGYTWTYEEDGEERTVAVDTLAPTDYAANELPDAALKEAVKVTASFDVEATGMGVRRWNEDALDAAGEAIEVDGLSFAVEPGYRYAILASFDAGEVTYAFTA